MSCDHVLGLDLADPSGVTMVRVSGLEEDKKLARERFEEWAKNPHALKALVEARRRASDDELFWEGGLRFRFCPECGEKNAP